MRLNFLRSEPEPEIEYIAVGDKVAVVASPFPDKIVEGTVIRWSDDPTSNWALIHIWYWDEWAYGGDGEYRHLYTWEPIENFWGLDSFRRDHRKLDRAVIEKNEAEAFAAAS
jgi:hypothetical protein